MDGWIVWNVVDKREESARISLVWVKVAIRWLVAPDFGSVLREFSAVASPRTQPNRGRWPVYSCEGHHTSALRVRTNIHWQSHATTARHTIIIIRGIIYIYAACCAHRHSFAKSLPIYIYFIHIYLILANPSFSSSYFTGISGTHIHVTH